MRCEAPPSGGSLLLDLPGHCSMASKPLLRIAGGKARPAGGSSALWTSFNWTAQLQKHDKERVCLSVPMSAWQLALQREKDRIKSTLPKITQPASSHTKHRRSGKE